MLQMSLHRGGALKNSGRLQINSLKIKKKTLKKIQQNMQFFEISKLFKNINIIQNNCIVYFILLKIECYHWLS